MTPEEKALIDARREGYVLAVLKQPYAYRSGFPVEEAAEAFPYPPEPPTYRDASGQEWRIVEGLEWRDYLGKWAVYADWLTPALIRGLHALLPPSTEEAPR